MYMMWYDAPFLIPFYHRLHSSATTLNIHQHVVGLLRLMAGSLKQFNWRVVPQRQVHK